MIQVARSFAVRSCVASAVAIAVALGTASSFAPAMARSTAAKGAVASKSTKAADAPPITTGSVRAEPTFAQRMAECMAIWEPRTHMTKSQWQRSCKTTLQSLAD